MKKLTKVDVEDIMYNNMSINVLKDLILESWETNKDIIIEDIINNDKQYIDFFSLDLFRRWLTPYFMTKAVKMACKQINRELKSRGLLEKVAAYFFINEGSIEQPYIFSTKYLSRYLNIYSTYNKSPNSKPAINEDILIGSDLDATYF